MYNNPNRELRLILTKSCNYKCVFCHDEGITNNASDKLNSNDYSYLYNIAKNEFGFNSTTLTGGEPLIRNDIEKITQKLYDKGSKITLTTNGYYLKEKTNIGKYVERVNVSLHTLNKNKYESIVDKKNTLDNVIEGIKTFHYNNPEVEIRLNATIVKGINSEEKDIAEYIKFAEENGTSIKFLELYPNNAENFVTITVIEDFIENLGYNKIHPITRRSDYHNGSTLIGLSKIFCSSAEDKINPSNYCYENNDLFVTPNGKLKPCRLNNLEIDILSEVKLQMDKKLIEKIVQGFNFLGKECELSKIENKLKVM